MSFFVSTLVTRNFPTVWLLLAIISNMFLCTYFPVSSNVFPRFSSLSITTTSSTNPNSAFSSKTLVNVDFEQKTIFGFDSSNACLSSPKTRKHKTSRDLVAANYLWCKNGSTSWQWFHWTALPRMEGCNARNSRWQLTPRRPFLLRSSVVRLTVWQFVLRCLLRWVLHLLPHQTKKHSGRSYGNGNFYTALHIRKPLHWYATFYNIRLRTPMVGVFWNVCII